MKTLISAILLVFAVMAPANADQKVFAINGWEGLRLDNEGAFSHCAALNFPREDETLILAIGRDGQLAVAARSPDWTFRQGAVLMATVTVDGDLIANQIQATGNGGIRFVYTDTTEAGEVYKAFLNGRALSIRTPAGAARFSLDGVPQVLDALVGCARQALAQEGSPPIASGDGTTQAVRLDQAEAMVYVVNFLAAAGLSGQVYLSPSEYKDVLPDYDVAWRNPDGTLGAAALYGNAQHSDLDLASANILRFDATRCTGGDFASGVRKSEETEGSFIKELFTTCDAGDGGLEAYYVMYVTKDGLFVATATISLVEGQQEAVEEKGAAIARGIERSF